MEAPDERVTEESFSMNTKFCLLILLRFLLAMKRRAPDGDANERPLKIPHIEPAPGEPTILEDNVIGELIPLENEVDGENIPMDIWFTVFINTTGDVLHHISAVCKRFRVMILQGNHVLKNEYDSPLGGMEALATRITLIAYHDLNLVNYALPALYAPNFNLIRAAKMLVRSSDFIISQQILQSMNLSPIDPFVIINTVLHEFGLRVNVLTFPKTIETFFTMIRN